MERLILDTGVLVALERGREILADVLPDDADIVIAAITASELRVGVELADSRRRATRRATVDAIVDAFDVVPFDLQTARHHAVLLAHARRLRTAPGSAQSTDRRDRASHGPDPADNKPNRVRQPSPAWTTAWPCPPDHGFRTAREDRRFR